MSVGREEGDRLDVQVLAGRVGDVLCADHQRADYLWSGGRRLGPKNDTREEARYRRVENVGIEGVWVDNLK